VPAGEVETPSEDATYGWVEAVALDVQGAAVGSPRRLTSATGHVGTYAITSRERELVVVAEDEGTTSGRGGGSLERIVWRGEGAPESSVIVQAGVEEETPPSIVSNGTGLSWLTFLDTHGDVELASLEGHGSGASSSAASRPVPTHEPLFEHGRLLVAKGDRVAFATTDSTGWSVRWAACAQP
jgi:hypothetical protein